MSLKINFVTKKFKDVTALNKVTMEFLDNKITGLIGFNGSGKTTAFNILTNLIEKFDGSVLIKEPNNDQYRSAKLVDHAKFSYLSAGSEPKNSDRVINHFYYVGALHGLSRAAVKIKIKALVELLDFKSAIDKKIRSLSKGNQQKIKLISAFLNPNLKYLLLDEPFDGLDPVMVEKIKKFILKKEELTIIITSHRLDVVDQMCDAYYILKDGVVADYKDATIFQADKTIIIATNKEMSVARIKKIKGVVSAVKNNQEIIIVAENMQSFKFINQKLMLDPKYRWSSHREKKLTESVFESYENSPKK